ncbi:hypothetical protein ACHAWF_018094 [Thalassiosira exigua]
MTMTMAIRRRPPSRPRPSTLTILLASLLGSRSGLFPAVDALAGLAVPPRTRRATLTITALPASSRSEAEDAADAFVGAAVDRRSALGRGGAALAAALAWDPRIAAGAVSYDDSAKKRILITGSNSGIGLDAAQRLAVRGHEIVLACRTLAKAEAAADKIRTNVANDSEDAVGANELLKSLRLVPAECNLADLSSVKRFADGLRAGPSFDAVCLNAGLARNTAAEDVARTAQGFELTVGTNHLGHFYLNHLLLPLVEKERGRIVVTASSVHDPDSPGGGQGVPATLGTLEGLERAVADGTGRFDMVDGGAFNADKAYKDSKMCNVFFTRELQRRLASSGSKVVANSFTPGLIVGTGLFRDQNPVFTKLFDVAATNLLKVGESTHYGGGALEYMTLSEGVGEGGGRYYYSAPGSGKYGDDAYGKQFDTSEVSREAREADENGLSSRFWELSEKLVGI